MNITKIHTVTLPVADQDRAKHFYAETLGFDVQIDQSFGPMRWIQVAPKDAQTGFVLHPDQSNGQVSGLILHTEAIDTDCTALRASGVEVDGPVDQPWGRQATFSDPDGNTFVLTQT